LRPASMQIRPNSEDYLIAHQEFSPSADVNGGATYIRAVSYSSDEAALPSKPSENQAK